MGVVEVAVAMGEIVALHSVIFLEMADDGLDGGAASHLSFDLRAQPSLLLRCIDFLGRTNVAGQDCPRS
jgi:hypothetical protein